jgi:hypothetical protein
MRIYICLLLLFTSVASAEGSRSSKYEVTPLYDHEMKRPSVYGGEIGNGAPYGGDDISCSDPSDYASCYDVIQTSIGRAMHYAQQEASNSKYSRARSILRRVIASSVILLEPYSESGGLLQTYLQRGIEVFNQALSGNCVNVNNTSDCLILEDEVSYNFLNAYLGILLQKAYSFDMQVLLPLRAGVCGFDPNGSTTAHAGYVSRYMELQREFLGLVNNIKVGNSKEPVNYKNSFYEAKITASILDTVARDVQTYFPFSAFVRNISVVEFIVTSDILSNMVESENFNSLQVTRELQKAKTVINEFIRASTSYVYHSDSTVDCSRRK